MTRSTRLALGFIAIGSLLASGPSALSQGPIVGPGQPILCPQAAQVPIGTSGSTRIVQGAAGKIIVVCGWHVTNSAASGTFQFTSGTGTNCGTGTANVSPAFTVTSTAPATDHIDYAMLQVGNTATPLDLCINPSVATIAAFVYFNQF